MNIPIQRRNNENGFTLIELIVVMAIIAILVLLAAPSFLNHTKDAKVTALQQDTKVLSDAVEMYHTENDEWPIEESKEITFGVGGIDALYALDEAALEGKIKNIEGDYTDYALSTEGKYAGEVFHIDGIENKKEIKTYSHRLNDAVLFNGEYY